MVRGENDFLNYFKTPEYWDFEGKYDIPKMSAIRLKNKKAIWLENFNTAYQIPVEERKKYTVHFFLADYLFERTWTRAKQTCEYLKGFKACLSPDFSQYTDMPRAMCIWNHYRKMWVSRYWQDNGIRVIPTACWSDEDSFEYCFDGMPKHSIIAVSSVGVAKDPETIRSFRLGYELMKEVLQPTDILWYGKKLFEEENVIYCPHLNDEKFKGLRAKRKLEALKIEQTSQLLIE